MANRLFTQNVYTLEKGTVILWAKVAIGASGAPTLDAVNSKGIKSITRTSAGLYVLTLGNSSSGLDVYNRILFAKHQILLAAGTPAALLMFVKAQTVATTCLVTVQFTAVDGTTATDPASGEEVWIEIKVKNSNAQ